MNLYDRVIGVARRHPGIVERILRIGRVRRWLNRRLIERAAGFGSPRPRPYSLRMPYTSWCALTDRRFTGRQLGEDHVDRDRPDPADLMPLFRREGPTRTEGDTSLLLAYFAQWFTDSFIRSHPETSAEAWRQNLSNHEIDLCQIYGLSEERTNRLRDKAGGRGRLKTSRGADGEEWPARLLAEGSTHDAPIFADPDFEGLFDPGRLRDFTRRVREEDLPTLFATGLEQGNATPGNIVLNTIFLRAHNHIADLLGHSYPDWDDEQLFQTTRNVLTVILLKITLRDYISQIASFPFPFDLDPTVGETKPWKRSNWISMEFGILYRWHMLVPDAIAVDGRQIPMPETLSRPPLVTETGLGPLLTAASRQPAGRIGLRNTPAWFTEDREIVLGGRRVERSIQQKTVEMGRRARLKPYNAYRRAFGLDPVRSFLDLTGDAEDAEALAGLYGSVDDLDWYVGLIAERHAEGAMMGELMTRMVAFDAFTHIFGNPLVATGVFREETFSARGMDLIKQTDRFQQVVDWVVPGPDPVVASFRVV